jgi:opacity protein-like surface antigen
MKRWLLIAAAAACALCESARAAPVNLSDPYIDLSVGVAARSDLAFDGVNARVGSGPAGSIGFGFARFIGPVDLRLDYATTDRDSCFIFCGLENRSVTSGSTMLSALYNIPAIPDRLDAYAGAGAGIVKVDAEHTGPDFLANDNYSGSDKVFGWQLIGGARMKFFNGPIRFFLEYRYQSAKDAHVAGHTVEYKSNSFAFGARWTFWGAH